jgi:ankyrin repeat protein
MEDRFPEGTLPFAESNNDILLIGCTGQRRSKIGLWIRDDELSLERNDNWHLVADDINELSLKCNFTVSPDFESVMMKAMPGKRAGEVSSYDIDSIKRDGAPLLVWAANNRYFDLCRTLLERGADPNVADGKGRSPLFYAMIQDAFDLVCLLISFGARPPDVEPVIGSGTSARRPLSRIREVLYPGRYQSLRWRLISRL